MKLTNREHTNNITATNIFPINVGITAAFRSTMPGTSVRILEMPWNSQSEEKAMKAEPVRWSFLRKDVSPVVTCIIPPTNSSWEPEIKGSNFVHQIVLPVHVRISPFSKAIYQPLIYIYHIVHVANGKIRPVNWVTTSTECCLLPL